jgi:hypothetical protein
MRQNALDFLKFLAVILAVLAFVLVLLWSAKKAFAAIPNSTSTSEAAWYLNSNSNGLTDLTGNGNDMPVNNLFYNTLSPTDDTLYQATSFIAIPTSTIPANNSNCGFTLNCYIGDATWYGQFYIASSLYSSQLYLFNFRPNIVPYLDAYAYHGKVWLQFFDFFSGGQDHGLSADIIQDGWNSIAIRRSGTSIQIWLNGSVQISDTGSTGAYWSYSPTFYIGKDNLNGPTGNLIVKNTAVFWRALSDSEIASMDSSFGPGGGCPSGLITPIYPIQTSSSTPTTVNSFPFAYVGYYSAPLCDNYDKIRVKTWQVSFPTSSLRVYNVSIAYTTSTATSTYAITYSQYLNGDFAYSLDFYDHISHIEDLANIHGPYFFDINVPGLPHAPTSYSTSTNYDFCQGQPICDIFLPSQAHISQFSDLGPMIEKKPPVGYLMAMVDVISSTSTATSSLDALNSIPSNTDPASPFALFRTAMGWVLWLLAGSWSFIRIKHLNIW